MKNVVNGKTIENVTNRINVNFVRKKKYCLKWTSKLSYMSHKIFSFDT